MPVDKNFRRNEKIEELSDVIVDAIQDVKGLEIIRYDLRALRDAPTDFFIICHGSSHVQVVAIADRIMKNVYETLGDEPYHSEGKRAAQWVLVDFFNIVVHVFYHEARTFYNLDELWSDAVITKY